MKEQERKKLYETLDDEQLVQRYRQGEEEAGDFLLNKYKYRVRNRAGRMFLIGGETDDLIQEGMIGLFNAIRDYDPKREASFGTFAEVCISRKMYNAIEASKSQKAMPLNDYISLYARQGDQGDGSALEEKLIAPHSDPAELVMNSEKMRALESAVREKLTKREREAFRLFLTGLSSREAAEVLGWDPKATDNAITRAKGKLRQCLEQYLS